MAAAVKPTRMRNRKEVVNPAYLDGIAKAPQLFARGRYGNVIHMDFCVKFMKKDELSGMPQADRYTRTVKALQAKFSCSEATAKAGYAALQHYRKAVFMHELPNATHALVDDWRRIAAKAEKDGDYSAASAALYNVAKTIGVFAPLQVKVEHSQGPSVQQQLRAVIGVLSPAARAGLELALAELEAAKSSGKLQLESGDEEPAPPMSGVLDAVSEDVEDAEIVQNVTG